MILFVSILLCFLNAYFPIIFKYVYKFSSFQRTSNVQSEIQEIQKEMSSLSPTDEFPKYARLQRKLNKLKESYKTEAQDKMSRQAKIQFIVNTAYQVVITLVSVSVFWIYRSSPVVILNEKWFYPFGNLFSWPINTPGAISLHVWFLVSNTVAKAAANVLT